MHFFFIFFFYLIILINHNWLSVGANDQVIKHVLHISQLVLGKTSHIAWHRRKCTIRHQLYIHHMYSLALQSKLAKENQNKSTLQG